MNFGMPRSVRCWKRAGCTITCACTGQRRSWSGRANPNQAYETAVYLNDKYSLTVRRSQRLSRHCMVHRRQNGSPLVPSPIFGLIRYMSHDSAVKRFDARNDISQQTQLRLTGTELAASLALDTAAGHNHNSRASSRPLPAFDQKPLAFLTLSLWRSLPMAADPVVPAPELQFETEATASEITLHFTGRIVSSTASMLRDEVRKVIPEKKPIVLDLSKVSYMDSAGLGAMVGVWVSAKRGMRSKAGQPDGSHEGIAPVDQSG